MHSRFILTGLIAFTLVADATAQTRTRWRPGSILGGLRYRVQEAWQDRTDQEPTTAPAEGTGNGFTDHEYRNHSPHPARLHLAEPPLSPTIRPSEPQRQPQPQPQQLSRAVSINDVIELVRRGLGESTIVQYIGDNGVTQRLDISDLMRLHDEGVSEPIINAMQTARVPAVGRHPSTMLPVRDSFPVSSDPRYLEPPQRAREAEGLGPSILEPPHRPVPGTPTL